MNFVKLLNMRKFFNKVTLFTTIIFTTSLVNQAGSAVTNKNQDTARNSGYLTKLEKDVILELNKVRTNPPQYAKVQVAKLKTYYKGNLIRYPGKIPIMTEEGVKAVNECFNVLLKTQPMGLLSPSSGLSKAAKELVKDQSGTSRTGHESRNVSSPFDRMNRYGKWMYSAAENIDYGYNQADQIVLSLLVDDGVAGRGHRDNILNPNFKVIGVAGGTHKLFRNMFVMDFATGYKEK